DGHRGRSTLPAIVIDGAVGEGIRAVEIVGRGVGAAVATTAERAVGWLACDVPADDAAVAVGTGEGHANRRVFGRGTALVVGYRQRVVLQHDPQLARVVARLVVVGGGRIDESRDKGFGLGAAAAAVDGTGQGVGYRRPRRQRGDVLRPHAARVGDGVAAARTFHLHAATR